MKVHAICQHIAFCACQGRSHFPPKWSVLSYCVLMNVMHLIYLSSIRLLQKKIHYTILNIDYGASYSIELPMAVECETICGIVFIFQSTVHLVSSSMKFTLDNRIWLQIYDGLVFHTSGSPFNFLWRYDEQNILLGTTALFITQQISLATMPWHLIIG